MYVCRLTHTDGGKKISGGGEGGAGICKDRMGRCRGKRGSLEGEGWFPREAAAVYKLPTMSVDSGWRFSRLPSIPLRIVSTEQSADARAYDTEVAFDINVVLLSPLKSNPSPTRQRASLFPFFLFLSPFPFTSLICSEYFVPPPPHLHPSWTRENVRSFALIMHSQVFWDLGSVRACTIVSTTTVPSFNFWKSCFSGEESFRKRGSVRKWGVQKEWRRKRYFLQVSSFL